MAFALGANGLFFDLVWFGVIRAVNLQTSFMHPPFGFALFYLRSVASRDLRTSGNYRGAVPFVIMQLMMVGAVILFPTLATGNVEKHEKVDIDAVRIEAPPDGAYPGNIGDDDPAGLFNNDTR